MAVSYVGAGALAHGTTGSISAALPAGWTTGDLLLIIFASASESYSPPTGFVTAKAANCGGSAGASNTAFINVAYKIADGSEISPIAIPGTSSNHRMAQILAYRGVDTVAPLVTSEAINNNTGTTAAASLTLPALGPNSAKNAIPFFAAAFATNVNGVWTSTTSVNERVDNGTTDGNASAIVVSDWAGINDMGGPGGTVGPPSATITPGSSTQIAAVGLMIYPIATQAIVLTGTLGSVTGAIAVKNKDAAAVAGTLQRVTGAIAVANKEAVSVAGTLGSVTGAVAITQKQVISFAGTLGSVTGAIAVVNKIAVAVAGTLGAVTGAIAVANKDAVAIAGVLGSVSGDMTIEVTQGVQISAAGTLGAVTAEVVVANKIGLDIAGTLAQITGEIVVPNKDGIAIAGTLGAVVGSASIAFRYNLLIAGTLGSVTGRAFARVGAPFFPTDDDFIITVPALDRVIDIPAVNREITVPGLDRILKVG